MDGSKSTDCSTDTSSMGGSHELHCLPSLIRGPLQGIRSSVLTAFSGQSVLQPEVLARGSSQRESLASQVCYSPNDEVLASAGYDQSVKVWDCRGRNWEPVQTMRTFADSVTSVTITSGWARCQLVQGITCAGHSHKSSTYLLFWRAQTALA